MEAAKASPAQLEQTVGVPSAATVESYGEPQNLQGGQGKRDVTVDNRRSTPSRTGKVHHGQRVYLASVHRACCCGGCPFVSRL
jgi:hypothetical protein